MKEQYPKVLETILNNIFGERTTAECGKDCTIDHARAVKRSISVKKSVPFLVLVFREL